MRRKFSLAILVALMFTVSGSALAQDPPPYADYTVLSVTEYPDFLVGLNRTSAYLAPDGLTFAYVKNTEVCFFALPATEPEWCVVAEDEDNRMIDAEEVRWSPDGRYLTFTTNHFLQMLRDPDLWVIDVDARTATNVTDDGTHEVPLFGEQDVDWPLLDMMPRWSADGSRILFLRLSEDAQNENEVLGLFTIAPDGSDMQQVGTIDSLDHFPVYALDWSQDGTHIVFNYWTNHRTERDGVWISQLDGSDLRQVLQSEPALIPNGVTFSADMDYVLTFIAAYNTIVPENRIPEHSMAQVVALDSTTSLLIDETRVVIGAAWSPTGHALAYLVKTQQPDEAESGLYITSAPGEPGRLIYPGVFTPPTPNWIKALTWADNDTLLLSAAPEKGLIVLQLGVE